MASFRCPVLITFTIFLHTSTYASKPSFQSMFNFQQSLTNVTLTPQSQQVKHSPQALLLPIMPLSGGPCTSFLGWCLTSGALWYQSDVQPESGLKPWMGFVNHFLAQTPKEEFCQLWRMMVVAAPTPQLGWCPLGTKTKRCLTPAFCDQLSCWLHGIFRESTIAPGTHHHQCQELPPKQMEGVPFLLHNFSQLHNHQQRNKDA